MAIKAYLDVVDSRMKTEAVLALLVESAVVYCGIWVSTMLFASMAIILTARYGLRR